MIEVYDFSTKNRYVDIECTIVYPQERVSFYHRLNLYAKPRR